MGLLELMKKDGRHKKTGWNDLGGKNMYISFNRNLKIQLQKIMKIEVQ